MAFDVNPNTALNPRARPLKIAPGAREDTIFAQFTGPSPFPSYVKMMFIRVGMSGSTAPPKLFIVAGTGDEVPITATPTGVYRTPGFTGYVGDVQLITGGELPNVRLIQMGFDANTAETWRLGIKNEDAVDGEFTWVVAESVAETAQPWISVSPAALPFSSLVNRTGETTLRVDQSVQVSNKGTAPLTITELTPALPPLPSTLSINTAVPFTVAPGDTTDLSLRYTPPSTGPAKDSVALTVTALPPDKFAGTTNGHNGKLGVTATAQRLEVVLLLDDSGSMGTDPLGGFLPAGSPISRWGELESAANGFLDLLAHFGAGRGRFGVARFPAPDPANPSTYDLVAMTEITTNMAAAQTAISAVEPFNGTPMGDGLFRVLAPTLYFSSDLENRRWLMLMSDGAHNSGTHNPKEFISLAERKITLYALGYGIEGHTDVDHVLLKDLASGSLQGQIRHVNEEGVTATDLALQMRNAIKSGLTPATSPLDPAGVFYIGQGEVRHDVVITQYDSRAAFVLNWNTPGANRLRLELITPDCQVITPENAGTGRYQGVTFRSTDRSQMYLVDPYFLQGGSGDSEGSDDAEWTSPSGTRPGTWTFMITSPDVIIIFDSEETVGVVGGVDIENYVYDVIVDSTLRVELAPDRDTYYAGDPITLTARLTADGIPIRGAVVSMSTTKPTESFTNWLAGLVVPAAALRQAQEELAGKDSSPMLVKQRAAQIAKLTFPGGTDHASIPMTDPDGNGTYSATFHNTSVPELYTFYVTAFGVTADGVSFRREGKQETFVMVRPDPAFTQLEVTQLKPGVATVTVIPRDQFGNVLLVDPATSGSFQVTAPDARVGAISSGLDGTYTTTVTFDPKSSPQIGFGYGGVQVIDPVRTVPLGELHYPDRVVSFEAGQIKKANRHDDPRAALGNVGEKPADRFVSLGAGGRIVLAMRRQLILAEADDDITVFVVADSDLRSYRVEAFSLHTGGWVTLGESGGTTKSFGLRDAGLKFTPAIRIRDTSGRTRDRDLNPLATPGVSIRGMGALRTTRDLPHGHWHWPDWWDRDDKDHDDKDRDNKGRS